MRRSRDKQPSRPSLKEKLFKTGAILAIGTSALTGCGANEAGAGSPEVPTTATTVETEDKSISIAELDGSERVPYTYTMLSGLPGGKVDYGPGVPEELRFSDVDELIGTTDEIAKKFEIPAGLNDEEFAKKIVDSFNYIGRLSRGSSEEYNLLPLAGVVDVILSERDYSNGDELMHAVGKQYYDAAGIMFADDATEAAREWRQRAYYNEAYNNIKNGSMTDNKKEGNTSDLEMFQAWDELDCVVSSEEKSDGGRYITIRFRSFNNSNNNGVFTEPSGQTTIDYSKPQTDTDTPILYAYHETTFVTSITDDGREVIENVNDTFIDEDQEPVK